MRFIERFEVAERFRGRTVAIVGSAPSSLANPPTLVDSHDIVVRVNNYKTGDAQGHRCDVHYAFYGTSIRKTIPDLKNDGVTLCMCKCPNSKPIESPWHEASGKQAGIDYRYIYRNRQPWWFTDTYIPSDETFLKKFELLGKHQPTTGFAAILDIIEFNPTYIFLTGFDFFTSGMHNVDEPWREKNLDDPIRHRPDLELDWIARNYSRHHLYFDSTLRRMLSKWVTA